MSDFVHQMLERNAKKNPNDLATLCHVTHTKLTWLEENQLANQLANLLTENDIKQNDHVAILFSNQIEFVLAYFAVLKTGARVIPLNVQLTGSEIKEITQAMDVKVILYHHAFVEKLKDISFKVISFSITEKDQLQGYSKENLDINLTTEDIAEILLTSGTTGKPKGVMLSHRAVYQAGMMMIYEMDIHYNDRILQLMPLTHSAPLNLMLVGSVAAGAVSILDNFSPDKLLEHTQTDKVTHFFGAPIAYLLALKILQTKNYDLQSMKKWIYGGAPMPSQYLTTLQKQFSGDFVGVYGLTEAGPNGLALYPHEHEKHIGKIGRRATVNTEFKVVDNKGNNTGVNQEGEILLKTSSMMSGYYKNPEATRENIKEGWLYTGDIGKIDEDGYLHIIDRKKDVIISGGVNIYPSEVEKAIISHPAVQDVTVIGKPHEEWGETTIAIIVKAENAEATTDQIKETLRDKLAKYKIPRDIVFVDELPRNATGKILKHVLREQYK